MNKFFLKRKLQCRSKQKSNLNFLNKKTLFCATKSKNENLGCEKSKIVFCLMGTKKMKLNFFTKRQKEIAIEKEKNEIKFKSKQASKKKRECILFLF